MSVTDDRSGTPVALLGCAGPARDRMREVLELAGVHLVLEEDPVAIDAQTLRDAEPKAVLIALEPRIEDALDELQSVLVTPGLTVIYDEADLAARRNGWDAQRWARHLLAKLHGHSDVLPPWTKIETQAESKMPALSGEIELDVEIGPVLHQQEFFDATSVQVSTSPLKDEAEIAEPVAGDWKTWSLVEEINVSPVSVHKEPDMAMYESSGMTLLEQEEKSVGAVLVMAGIGGPDAIRQLLSALPVQFPRAVLISMALHGGQYGKLVRQVARVSSLVVGLGEIGQTVLAGHVYILPDGISVKAQAGSLVLVEGSSLQALFSAVLAADSAVLMLSGADVELVDSVLAIAAQGAWVAGQSAGGCYDPRAAQLLVQHGKDEATPTQLAQALVRRWPV